MTAFVFDNFHVVYIRSNILQVPEKGKKGSYTGTGNTSSPQPNSGTPITALFLKTAATARGTIP
jgi:hypothetical protein